MYNLKELDASVVTGPDGLISVGAAAPGKAEGLTDAKVATLVLADAALAAEQEEQQLSGTKGFSHLDNRMQATPTLTCHDDALLKNYASVSFPLGVDMGGGFEQIAVANADEDHALWRGVRSAAIKLPQNTHP